ncbi:MAG: site-specific integrase [Flavobacteriaceae bacterium]|nr:site-specific integrase [Flavobacteriaceae bacterium]
MASVQPILHLKKSKQGLYPIVIRVTHNRKSIYIYSGQYVDEKYWDKSKKIVKKSYSNSVRLNNFIASKILLINNLIFEHQNNGVNELNLSKIKKIIQHKNNNNSFYKFADAYFIDLENNKKFNRINSEKPLLNRIKKFHKKTDLEFKEITTVFLQKFIAYNKRKGNIGGRSIANNLVFIRTLFNKAIAQDIIKQESYPFGKGSDKIKIYFPESIKIGLTIEEIQSIENLHLEEERLVHARNVWLFSFYFAGMRVGDVLQIKWNDIQDGRLYYRMNKNSKPISLKIPDKALPIIECYKNEKRNKSDYIFPDLKNIKVTDIKALLTKTKSTNKRLNSALKIIAEMVEIDKKLTMHIARHSFGNISGDKIPIQMLQRLYRHSSIVTTINYQASFTHKDADDALDKVVDF